MTEIKQMRMELTNGGFYQLNGIYLDYAFRLLGNELRGYLTEDGMTVVERCHQEDAPEDENVYQYKVYHFDMNGNLLDECPYDGPTYCKDETLAEQEDRFLKCSRNTFEI